MTVVSLRTPLASGLATALLMLAGCAHTSSTGTRSYTQKDRECMARAMYFESHRSSHSGLLAVGTVVMNRVASDAYPDTVCGVVGQKGQFASGVLSRPMNSRALPNVQKAANAVLSGKRHPGVQKARFFHTAGLTFPYDNMHYVLVAGGNAFYEKRSPHQVKQPTAPSPTEKILTEVQSGARSR